MINTEKIQQFQSIFGSAGSVLVILPPQPTLDQTAAALSLFSVAEAAGKEVAICCPELETITNFDLQLTERITNDLGKRDLCVSFDYRPETIDKVSYNIDEVNQKFYLLIKPQKGHKPLATESVQFSYAGADADLVFLVGVHSLETLEQLYFGYEQLYQTAQVVVMHTFEPEIGTLKLDTSGMSSLSEGMTQLLAESGIVLTPEAATNLLAAIETATDNLSSLTITAETFDRLAFLLRSGAFRKRRNVAQRRVDALPFKTLNEEPQRLVSKPQNSSPEPRRPKFAPPSRPVSKQHKKNHKKKMGGLDYQPNELSIGSKV